MQRSDFEQLVREAVAALPLVGRQAMENIAFVVEGRARRRRGREVAVKKGQVLLGLYEGIPKTKRGAGYVAVLPDKITIFQEPIVALAGDEREKVRALVNDVVWHEVGHHLGFDEREIRAREMTRKRQSA